IIFAGGWAVLKQMKKADLNPNAETYSYLINHAKSLKEAVKYYKKIQRLNIPLSKHVFMAIINIFVKYDELSKAKEVVKDQRILDKYLIEIKSALITALASHGRVSEAFEIYDDIKQVGDIPEPKAIVSLI
ncbi:hypothetical protein KI387_020496, partial [Taxus chinensis]